ncbi:hypothetical protein [Marinobacter sp. F4206]|uniref:hypothetical protein n=1 Tax=Marinobacter sp. F4206 TaxID=2861777 RepID=UPI001C5DD879|nr:hypothetical protein [Marinobacter sp. F4206]MBW4936166.1 hypothetical protein [Marinobacter sp. F4206]
MELYQVIIASAVANGVAIGAIGFLCKSIIAHFLTKDVETFKNKLQLESEHSISSYRSELEKERIRLQISYGGIFEKQANVIINLYQLIVGFERSIDAAVHAAGDKGEQYEEFIIRWRELLSYLDENRLLIPESVENLFEKFHRGVFYSVRDYRVSEKRMARRNMTNNEIEKLLAKQDKALADLDQIPAIKRELTESLRGLIGVTDHARDLP